MMIWPPANAIYRRETHDNYPAAKAILQSVYEGLQLPMDLALKVEIRYFAKILRSKEAAAMIRTLFVSMQELNKGARRPDGRAADHDRRRSACSGPASWAPASPMSRRNAGLEVVLVDRDLEAAEKGKAHSHKLVTDQIMKGRAKTADRDALLARITPTRRLRRPARLRPHRRGGVRGPEGEGRGDRQGRGGDPARRASSPPTPRPCRSPASPRPRSGRTSSSASTSSRRSRR